MPNNEPDTQHSLSVRTMSGEENDQRVAGGWEAGLGTVDTTVPTRYTKTAWSARRPRCYRGAQPTVSMGGWK